MLPGEDSFESGPSFEQRNLSELLLSLSRRLGSIFKKFSRFSGFDMYLFVCL
jgi:hypothetical protein